MDHLPARVRGHDDPTRPKPTCSPPPRTTSWPTAHTSNTGSATSRSARLRGRHVSAPSSSSTNSRRHGRRCSTPCGSPTSSRATGSGKCLMESERNSTLSAGGG
jgi:hypothetical protein